MLWRSTPTFNVTNADNLTSEVEKAVPKWWTKVVKAKSLTLKSWYVQVAVQSKLQTVKNTAKSSYPLNAVSAVQWLSGSAGETHISVINATKSKHQGSTSQD